MDADAINHGIDYKNRKIYLFDEFESNTIGTVIKGIYSLNAQSIKKPIELIISSFGGEEYEMFALYDAIKTSKAPVYTHGIGKIMSAAILILASGQKGHRIVTPNTFFMIHQGFLSVPEISLSELKIILKHFDRMVSRWCHLMAKNSNVSAFKWKVMCEKNFDYYFTADQALKLGIIDSVLKEIE